jgi:hypothetical protein
MRRVVALFAGVVLVGSVAATGGQYSVPFPVTKGGIVLHVAHGGLPE